MLLRCVFLHQVLPKNICVEYLYFYSIILKIYLIRSISLSCEKLSITQYENNFDMHTHQNLVYLGWFFASIAVNFSRRLDIFPAYSENIVNPYASWINLNDVMMSAMASQITDFPIVYSYRVFMRRSKRTAIAHSSYAYCINNTEQNTKILLPSQNLWRSLMICCVIRPQCSDSPVNRETNLMQKSTQV